MNGRSGDVDVGAVSDMGAVPTTVRRMFGLVVHGIGILEIGTVLFYASRYQPGVASGSGGQEIGLFFDALMLAALLPAELTFLLAKTREVRAIAGCVILAPVTVAGYVALGSRASSLVLTVVLGVTWWVLARVRRNKKRAAPERDGLGDP